MNDDATGARGGRADLPGDILVTRRRMGARRDDDCDLLRGNVRCRQLAEEL
jgi:hypothetical protein